MTLRIVFLAFIVLPFTLFGLPVQLSIVALRLPFWQVLPAIFFKLVAFGLGLRVSLAGQPLAKGPVLIVANHIGWLDIVAVASKLPVSFVAKSEVARWPVIGTFARLHRTIFVDRTRRTDTRRTAAEMSARIAQDVPVLLFAEGTSGIGTHVLPFRSALMGAALQDGARIQPLAIAYTKISGLPLSRSERRQIAWIGDMGIGDNLGAILGSGPKDVVLAFGAPIPAQGDRKRNAQRAENTVRRMLNALNRCDPLPRDGEVV
ncbi:lysophospholipid acyltransferase family protein [Pelagibacterium halotolerans]|uniref:1-acyl-sn-glycerol-3-phosphate acyltransferase n=1 Tax=Pelagibacterium halotolerans (strain DSM 22347 / JCM 15775 / CGMCC 1.7692 / B2) TaxID=1082931 RepID=G4R8I5_PELHB|nr:lysophospholipid acyltransferase family protein [Pelagibacterium halotolerans]AEQ53388.1 1-acyl-sn-glycerol-3-phosphate acyltransferase [Pelagibacterium halotolerans B2]QJR17004.1 1-acyl-sn-glycerol-3-phosphate acyltransferase [Pelagibacterium halotolerans]